MKDTQKSKILALLRESPNRQVSCGELSHYGLYHHGSQRIGELKKMGFVIEFVKHEDWDKSYYHMTYDKDMDNEQLRFA